MRFECISRTHVGLRRKVNEDAVLARTELGLWAVADGMGGHEAGEVASATVVDALSHVSPANDLDTLVEESVLALQDANQQLQRLARSKHTARSIGSTVVGLAIANGRYGCFWAGDSRAYRVSSGRITLLTRDHSLVQTLVDAGLLSAAEAEDHPDANVITHAVGVAQTLEVDTVSGRVNSGDQFLLASDGLTKLVAESELLAELAAHPPEEAADRLVQTVLSRGAPDNVSLLIIRVT